MLYLRRTADEVCGTSERRFAISDETATRLERALLAADVAICGRELTTAILHDSGFLKWVSELIECRTGRAPATIDEAATWLSRALVSELAAALGINDDQPDDRTGIAWRLPALVARLDDFDRRLEFEKIESLKELAYGASHEINNPLANIAARAQTLLEGEGDAERRRKLEAIHRQALRAHEMIADLMLFARPPKLSLAACDLRSLVVRAVEEHRQLAAQRNIRLDCQLGENAAHVMADETQLAVAVAALVTNAIEAVGANSIVQVAVRATEIAGQRTAEILVRDDGPGISPEVRRHMFDPFYSGREAGRGLGFGLSKCWRIVTDHGGRVIVNQPAGRGAEIAIQLRLPPLPADGSR